MIFQASLVRDLCPATSETESRALLSLLNLRPGADYAPGQALVAWIQDLLLTIKLLDEKQLWYLLENFYEKINQFAEHLEKALQDSQTILPVTLLGFADRRYAFLQGSQVFLDLHTQKTEETAEVQFLETITYNLTTLYCKKKQDYLQLKEESDDKTSELSSGK